MPSIYPVSLFQSPFTPVACPVCDEPLRGVADGARGFPCDCELDAEWAAAFDVEMSRRMAGEPARDIEAVYAKAQKAQITKLCNDLNRLYSRQVAAEMTRQRSRRQEIEQQICICWQSLYKLSPQSITQPPLALLSVTQGWASKQGYMPSPQPKVASLSPDTRVQLGDIQMSLARDPRFSGLPPQRIVEMADKAFHQLLNYIHTGAPVEQLVADLVAGQASELQITFPIYTPPKGKAIDYNPEQQFTQSLAAPPKRRKIDSKRKGKNDDA